jgi:ComF family protein
MLKQLLSVFLQSRCAFCQRPTPATLCEYCQQKLLSHQLPKCDRLRLDRNLSVFAWGKYDGQLKRAIALMKYNNKPELGRVLGELLARAWLHNDLIKPRQITVVPIPLHHQKLKERGFNQAHIIAQSFCQITGYSLNSQALIRAKKTKAMFDLNPDERVENLQGAFKAGNKLPKHPVLFIDDIYTTGTTIKESVKVLSEVKVIGVAVVAKTRTDRLVG